MHMSEQDPSAKDLDYIVPALQRGLRILELFNSDQRNLNMNELAELMGGSVSSIYRIVQTLAAMGYLQKVGKNGYELGPQLISRGFTYLASRDIVDVALPHLNTLRDRTSLSCHLSIREQHHTLYIYRSFAQQRLSVNIPIGTRIPCHCNAMGKMLLSSLSETELESLYQSVRLDDHMLPGPKTLPELKQAISEARRQGWVLSRSDYATAIATAIRDHEGNVVAAINVSGPDAMMAAEGVLERTRDMLLECARQISAEAGYRPAALT
jgi:IclR family pca regulon transcriptional regulator